MIFEEPAFETIATEYGRLCQILGLKPVVLDVFRIIDGSSEATPAGSMTRGRADAAYGKGFVVIPVDGLPIEVKAFPPRDWRLFGDEWPSWRVDVWHEVVHQVQDQRFGMLRRDDGREGHANGWPEALAVVAAAFDADASSLEHLVRPSDL